MKKLSMDELERPDRAAFASAEKMTVCLVLDNVRSALNVGSAFRTGDAFAIEKIWLGGISAQPPNREILKTALGSTETVAWEHGPDTAKILQKLKADGWKIWAVEQAEPRIWLQHFGPRKGKKIALVFGNEVDGVSEKALAECDGSLEIPQAGTKHSLNVSVAVGIVLWQVFRLMRL